MFVDKLLSLTFGAAMLLLAACNGPAADAETATNTISVTQNLQHDPAFWDYAASSSMLQTEISRLAIEKGSTEKIKALGQQSADFHSNALKNLKKLVAKQKQIQLPDRLGAADKGLVQEFVLLEGEEFDTRYRDFMISTHTAQLDRYEDALRKADDQRTRDWLMNMRTHIRKELDVLAQPDSVAAPLL